MKTKNNVQKTITKTLAVIISLVLISLTVNAQDFWRTVLENNSFSHIAIAMVDKNEAATLADSYSDDYLKYGANDNDKALEIENWMMNESNFFTTLNVETDEEGTLEIENWMTNEGLFNGIATLSETEQDEILPVEDWMKDTDYFGVVTVELEEESDNTLQLENWMTDSKVW